MEPCVPMTYGTLSFFVFHFMEPCVPIWIVWNIMFLCFSIYGTMCSHMEHHVPLFNILWNLVFPYHMEHYVPLFFIVFPFGLYEALSFFIIWDIMFPCFLHNTELCVPFANVQIHIPYSYSLPYGTRYLRIYDKV